MIIKPKVGMFKGMFHGMGFGRSASPSGGADGFIGIEAAGSWGVYGGYWFWMTFTTTTAGVVNYIHTKIDDVATIYYTNVGIYHETGDLLAYGTKVLGTNDIQTLNIQLNTSVELEAAHTYTLVVVNGDNDAGVFWEGTTGTVCYRGTAPSSYDTLEATLPAETGHYANNGMVLWADNSAT